MKMSDIISISSLILTLLTFLFNLALPEITTTLEQDDQIAGDHAKRRLQEKISKILYRKAMPMLISFFLIFYITLPKALEIMLSSKLTIWNFDMERTVYIMLVYALLAFTLLNAHLAYKLFQKRQKLKASRKT